MVKNLLFSNGFGYIWEQHFVGNEREFLTLFKQRLEDQFIQKWREDVSNTSEFRLYKFIKDDFKFEPYLYFIKSKALRRALTSIRLSSHNFMVERGRWNKLQIGDRKCSVCDDVEDEFHCLVKCVTFKKFQMLYLPNCLKDNPNMYKFISWLKDSSVVTVMQSAKLSLNVLKQYSV